MIRMIQSSSAAHAKAYFSEALAKADYYLSDQELRGEMHGKLAERLGIRGPADPKVFFALCENRHPGTNAPLTPRTKENRTTGYDINFHCPKSVSVLHALWGDEHILNAFRQSVQQTMQDIEADALTRIRTEGQYDERSTGELVWAEFIHQTARPTDGALPDPHLHAHCFVFNVTHDESENRLKAVQFRDIKRDMPYYQARFHKRLSDSLTELGYEVQRTEASFEVKGVPGRVIDLFSKRTDEIGRVAKEKGITSAKELDALGARTRAKKQQGLSMPELRRAWKEQIRALPEDGSGEGNRSVRFASRKEDLNMSPETCVDHALRHGFERASVLHDRRLLAEAYRHGIGHRQVSLEAITDTFEKDGRLIHVEEKGRMMTTTRQVLAEERHMVQLAREGQGKLRPLYENAPKLALEGQQADAVRHVLTTANRVSIIRGAAGSGKTSLMKEAVKHLEQVGKTVTVVAPTAQASRGVLQSEGFKEATTVARLLTDDSLQHRLKGQVLWVDEAGLLGTKDMTALLNLATKQNTRLILGGDTRQHSSVVRGDALRILNTVGGIKTAEVSKIYRQKNEHYRSAVEDLSRGDVRSAFEKLDEMGVIREVDPRAPNAALVEDYVRTLKQKKSALVVSPTHRQSEEVTEQIRRRLRAERRLGKKELTAERLANANLTEAEKADWRNLRQGMVVQFNQNMPGLRRGSQWTVESSTEAGVRIRADEETTALLPLHRSGEYELYEKKRLLLSKGDAVRITRNGFDQHEKRLNNGQLLRVTSVKKSGEVVLQSMDNKTSFHLKKEFGHWAHAYCITSHAAQGKTVDEVLISQPASTFPATDAKQFYVSVSRGREGVRIYTDQKQELLQHAARLGDRTSAIELVRKKNFSQETAQQNRRSEREKTPPLPPKKSKEMKAPTPSKDKSYEPGI